MMMWLPRRLTSAKWCCSRTAQTSLPDMTRSLANGDLKLCDKHVAALASPNLFVTGTLIE